MVCERIRCGLKKGNVYLVGAGCGDPGLLTIRAAQLLQSCEVVLYDSLVQEELLQSVGDECEKIYVGKRYGCHARKQHEINQLLIQKAEEGKQVVRLKGGDPYVFGRGGEEFLAVKAAGIFCEEIPGISSAIAVPAAAGIPVTHRGLSGSVTVVTGTAAGEGGQSRLNLDFETLARLEGTLVILMGMHHIKEIADGLMRAGKHPDTPCAVIMNGSTNKQRSLRTVLSTLAQKASEQEFTSPAVIVIGQVAALELVNDGRDEGDSFFSGITIGAVGTPRFVNKLSQAFKKRGLDVLNMGFMQICPTPKPLPDFKACGWLVFTSPNGVKIFWEKFKQERRDLRSLSGIRIAVVGPGTAEALEEAGIYADYMPEVYDTVHLAKGLAAKILAESQQEDREQQQFAIFLRAKEGSAALPEIFTKSSIAFVDFSLYELAVVEQKRTLALQKRPQYIVFGSAMGVRAYFEGRRQMEWNNERQKDGSELQNNSSHYICIGQLCAEELKKYTDEAFLTAKESSIEGIVSALEEDVRIRGG